VVSLALIGCSGTDPEGDKDPTGDPAGTDLIGTFQVELTAEDSKTSILGKVSSGPTPAAIAWETAASSGDCKLETPKVPFCDPGCGSDVCVADNVCQPHPEARDAGDVRVSGLRTEDGTPEFSLIKVSSSYQAPPAVALVFPPFGEGDTVQFSAAGAEIAAFTLQAGGIAPLVVTSTDLAIAAGEDLSLSWEPASDPGASAVQVEVDISHHGGTKGVIDCETADDGSLTIDSALLDALVDLGVAGFPRAILSRRSVGSTMVTSGRIDLVLVSRATVDVSVPGVFSCNETADCPDGTECQTDLTCQ